VSSPPMMIVFLLGTCTEVLAVRVEMIGIGTDSSSEGSEAWKLVTAETSATSARSCR
jgi:hypothetical protein